MVLVPLQTPMEPPPWSGGGFAGAWQLQSKTGRLELDADVAGGLGLPITTTLDAFLAVLADADLAQVRSAVEAALQGGGRINRRFKLAAGPAAGQWARLSALATGTSLKGALTDLPGEGQRMEMWRDAEQRFRHAFDQTPNTAVQGYDRQRRVIYWNAASEELYGWRREEALGRCLENLIIPPPMRGDVIRLHAAWINEDVPIPAGELELQRNDGSLVPVFSSHVMLRNGWGEPEMYCIDVDLRQQRKAMMEGHLREHQLRLVSQANHAGWWDWDVAQDRFRWSAELNQWLGGPSGAEASLKHLSAAIPSDTWAQLEPIFQRVAVDSSAVDAEISHIDQGRTFHFLLHAEASDPTTPGRRVGTLLDITESKEAASRIDRLVRFDPVTGLPNRLLMRERLDEAVARAPALGSKVLVGCLGLDQFRLVNESYGTAVGDALLNACALRLQSRLRGHDLVVRLSGDRFGVLVEGVNDGAEAELVAGKLLALFQQPFEEGPHEQYLGASLGLSLYPDDGDAAELLLQQAETALHRTKEQGRGHHQFFKADMNQRSVERVQLLNQLRRALPQGELHLHFQPQVRLTDRSLQGAEALLRWSSAQLGNVTPDRFIPLAEETGLIEPIGDWVLARCCETVRDWRAAGFPNFRLAANLSGRQFRTPDLAGRLAREMERCGVPASALELEVTESVLLDPDGRTKEQLFALKDLGIRLAIDDFGTGYSSLSYLRRFPIDVLKIDRSFVSDLGLDADADALVCAIAGMARALKLSVVAEGVETDAQAAFLTELGCEAAQGWLFGRPVADADFRSRYLR
jgi:diguanylate cyclase (GGDEF)-like protein/PAS domain S-box-containing protein